MKNKINNKEQQIKIPMSTRIGDYIKKVIYICILIPLIIITINIVWQLIFEPDKIPDIFGYKLFIVLDGNMCDEIYYGDFIITKNVKDEDLKINNIIAFRNNNNTVTVHKVINVFERQEQNLVTYEKELVKICEMDIKNTVNFGTKYVKEEKIEGVLIYRVPKIGLVLYFIQQPIIMIIGYIIILVIGLISIYIAGKLDERDMKILEEQGKTEKNND